MQRKAVWGMKKWAMVLLCGILVLCAAAMPCLAESVEGDLIDFSQFTDDEMMMLNRQLQREMVERGVAGTASLMAGKYVGGKNIPVGSYVLMCATDENQYGIVWLSAAGDDLENEYPSILYEFVGMESEASYYLEVEEGILTVPFPVKLQIYTGIVFE
jgi:hypothetical protein